MIIILQILGFAGGGRSSNPAAASGWNLREPRADDVLFVGILVF